MKQNELKAIIRERGLSYSDLSKKTDLNYRTIQDIINGADCRVSSLKTIVEALGLELTISAKVELNK